MEEYKNTIIETLPLLLSPETKGKASIKIASNMNGILRKAQSQEDFAIFNEALQACTNFARNNNLNGLNSSCSSWNVEATEKWNKLFGKTNDISAAEIVQHLIQIREIKNMPDIDSDVLENAIQQIKKIEEYVNLFGAQLFTNEQLPLVMSQIEEIKHELLIKYNVTDDIFDNIHISR